MCGLFMEVSPLVDRQQTNAPGSSIDDEKTSIKPLEHSSSTFVTSIGMYFLCRKKYDEMMCQRIQMHTQAVVAKESNLFNTHLSP